MKAITLCFALFLMCLSISSMHGVVSAADPGDDGIKTFQMLKTAFKAQQDEFWAREGKVKPDEREQLIKRVHPSNTMPAEFFVLRKPTGELVSGSVACIISYRKAEALGFPISRLPSANAKRS